MKGLENHGNTCYFNTALQCLLYIPVLSNYFIRHPYQGDCKFTNEYSKMVKTYWTKGQDEIDINSVLTCFREKFPRFGTKEQHDVQEAILCIIDILETSRPEIKPWFTERRYKKLYGRVESQQMKKISVFI